MKKYNSKVVKNNHKISSFFTKTNQNVIAKNIKVEDLDVIPTTPVLTKTNKSQISDRTPSIGDSSKRKISNSDVNQLLNIHAINSPPRKKFHQNKVTTDYSIASTSKSYAKCSPISQSSIIKSATPEKRYIKPSPRRLNRTPRKSPDKLFSRSLMINDFDVEVIENFVKITPSKSSMQFIKSSSSNTSTKKQSPILEYIVVSPSKAMHAQISNETTPEKSPLRRIGSPIFSKARLNLNAKFAAATQEICNDNNEEDYHLQNMHEATENIQSLLDLDDSWEKCETEYYVLDLSTPQHCSVTEYIKKKCTVLISVESTKSGEKARCRLEGFWVWSKMNVGCTVYITAARDIDMWKITNEDGLLVYEPDILISNTSIVGALFCKRRSILKEKFMGFEPPNKVMVVGVLVHTLLQGTLKIKTINTQQIEDMLNHILSTQSTVKMMYSAGVTLDDLKSELSQFVPRIVNFMKDYVLERSNTKHLGNHWSGSIDTIEDIEENIWCPELGIKGKVDVSISSGKSIIPVELKTGRARVSMEHRGQVMLYIVMMSKLGYKVSSGLLLYLREGVLQEVPYNEKEKRDLVLLRNELTYFLTRKVQVNNYNEKCVTDADEMFVNQKLNAFQLPELPDPINHSACERCPYSILCCSYLKYENADLTDNKVLQFMTEHNLSHLSDLHVKYFVHFSNLLDLEGSEKSGKPINVIYTKTPQEREGLGKSITFVKVINNVVEYDGLYEHTFEKTDDSNTSLLTSGIGEGSYVIISTCQRPAVAAGIVSIVNHKTIAIVLERDLKLKYPNLVFHIDSYDSNSAFGFNFTSLSILLEPTEQGKRLRQLIVDKEPPTFKSKLPKVIAMKALPILRKLNKTQQRAALKACSANDYLLIKGMPGCGKTATIIALVQLLVELGNSILITSHTHAAVDNVCVRLKRCGIKVLRLGTVGRIHSDIKSMSEHEITKKCKTPEELEDVYTKTKVFAVTCLGTKHPVFNNRSLDVCIVDESTQVIQCSLFRAISVSKKFILIGDPHQLPPVVKNTDARKCGLSESLFERLETPEATVTLDINYRMNKSITQLANSFMYKGELKIANDAIGNAVLKIPDRNGFLMNYENEKWLTAALDDSLDSAVKVLDTGPVWKKVKNSIETSEELNVNVSEIGIVKYLITALVKGGVSSNCIGVISPYVAQVAQLSLSLRNTGVDVNTIDQFQGRDKEIILFSCTLSRDVQKSFNFEYHILEDRRRLNVAITRAKHKLIFICDSETIKTFTPFRDLLDCISPRCFIRLKDGNDGFNWDAICHS